MNGPIVLQVQHNLSGNSQRPHTPRPLEEIRWLSKVFYKHQPSILLIEFVSHYSCVNYRWDSSQTSRQFFKH